MYAFVHHLPTLLSLGCGPGPGTPVGSQVVSAYRGGLKLSRLAKLGPATSLRVGNFNGFIR